MPPLFKMRVTVNQELLNDLRGLPQRARWNMKREMQTDLRPYLTQEVNALAPDLAPASPAPPFEFGGVMSGISGYDTNNPSRRYYFALIRGNPALSDGQHWIRTGDIEGSFEVEVSDKFIENLVRIVNRHPKAKYLLSPWQVAGFRNSGWNASMAQLRQIIRKSAIVRIRVLWRRALHDALKGKGQ
jgi:hypothetical protein